MHSEGLTLVGVMKGLHGGMERPRVRVLWIDNC